MVAANIPYTEALRTYIADEVSSGHNLRRVDKLIVGPEVYARLRSEGAISSDVEDQLGFEAREMLFLPDFREELDQEDEKGYIVFNGRNIPIEVDDSGNGGLVTLVQKRFILPKKSVGRATQVVFPNAA